MSLADVAGLPPSATVEQIREGLQARIDANRSRGPIIVSPVAGSPLAAASAARAPADSVTLSAQAQKILSGKNDLPPPESVDLGQILKEAASAARQYRAVAALAPIPADE